MSTKIEMLKLLSSFKGQYLSGQEIGESLGVTRAAVNKAAKTLKNQGYSIETRPGQGYMLKQDLNLLSEPAICSMTQSDCHIQVFDTIDSTNDYAKTMVPDQRPMVVIADCQEKGRGRLGRSFQSPAGKGLYLSLVIKPDFPVDQALYITMASAVATCRAIEQVTEKSPSIKWVNDLYLNNRKICGILTEAVTNFETGTTGSIITGIGINCFPAEYQDEVSLIAGPISHKSGSFSRNRLAAALIDNLLTVYGQLESGSFMEEYKNRCFVIGRTVKVTRFGNEKRTLCKVLDITPNGGLLVQPLEGEKKGKELTLISGEISLEDFI